MRPNLLAENERPDVTNASVRQSLSPRPYPYWKALAWGRYIGYSHPQFLETYWVARYRRKNGLYRQFRIGTTDDAHKADGCTYFTYEQAVRRTWKWFAESAVDAGDPNPIGGASNDLIYCPVGKLFTFAHALKDYVDWKRLSSSPTHFSVMVSLINYHLLPRLGPIPLSELETGHFRNYFHEVLETAPKRGHRPRGIRQPMEMWDPETIRKRKKTVNALISISRHALCMAWENHKTDNDRLWRSLHRFPNVDRPRMLHLSRTECRALLTECPPDLRSLILGALYTGCRSLELLRMQAGDVGKDGYGVYVSPSKTFKPRFVFLPDEGMSFFLHLAKGKRPGELLFTRANGRHWGEYHRRLFKIACQKADLPEEFTFHGLRHTYASQLVQAGAPLTVVAEQLGHANTVSVSRTYGHVSPQIRESEVRQRFAVLSLRNAKAAESEKKTLDKWRRAFHGSQWRTYAAIGDLKSRSATRV
jgi:integrase/recombinase XerD